MSHSPRPARALVRFGEPTVRVWHPVLSRLTVRCDACGCACYPRETGELLHGPAIRRHPTDEWRWEAPPHAQYCPGRSVHLP